jgi:hypothetical protein
MLITDGQTSDNPKGGEMSEGIIGGVLGEHDDRPELESPEAQATVNREYGMLDWIKSRTPELLNF